MSDPRGLVRLTVGETEYRLWFGFSVLGDLQAKHGQDALQRLDPPPDAPPGWMPELGILVDLFTGALERYHADKADKYLADELIAEAATLPGGIGGVIAGAFPERKEAPKGNRKARRAA